MEMIIMVIKYGGEMVNITIIPEENIAGTIYPVELNEKYAFTLLHNEEDEFSVMKEGNAIVPFVEAELLEKIIKQLRYELRYAA